MRRAIVIVTGCLVIALPLLLLFGLQHLPARSLAAGFMAIAAMRLLLSRCGTSQAGLPAPWLLPALLLLLALLVQWSGDPDWFRFYPVAINGVLLALFGLSLRHGPPAIERLARLREPRLSPVAIDYTRSVTRVWCGFFLVNGAVALYTALYSPLAVWAWYNGGLAYVLMGLLFAGEFLVRRRVMRAHRG